MTKSLRIFSSFTTVAPGRRVAVHYATAAPHKLHPLITVFSFSLPLKRMCQALYGDLLSSCLHRQFHTLPGLLDSRAALSDLRAKQGGSLYHFYDGLWYDPAGRRTHDLPCERRTR